MNQSERLEMIRIAKRLAKEAAGYPSPGALYPAASRPYDKDREWYDRQVHDEWAKVCEDYWRMTEK